MLRLALVIGAQEHRVVDAIGKISKFHQLRMAYDVIELQGDFLFVKGNPKPIPITPVRSLRSTSHGAQATSSIMKIIPQNLTRGKLQSHHLKPSVGSTSAYI
jgi:hypothetical protein